MNKGTTIDPKRGQVWSLKVKDPEEESPSVLLLEDPEESGGSFVALAILEESWMACDQDVLLSDDPDWLLGLGWCIAVGGQELKVARDCLRAHLAEVDVLTLGLVRDFNLGKACSLPISDRLIPELGDRRVDGRRKYLDFVRQCAGIKIWKLAIRLVQSKIEAVLSGPVNEEIRPNVEPLALSPTRGSSDLQEAVRIRNLQVSPYVLEMTTACQEGDWVISFKVVEGSATELRLSGPRELSMMQTDDETWEPEELLLSGEEYQLILYGPSGNGQIVFDLG